MAKAFEKAVKDGAFAVETAIDIAEKIQLEVPKDEQHGDFACNIAMLLAKDLRMPPRKIAEAIDLVGIPSQVSYSAGTYVCNDVLYTLLNKYKDKSVKVGFIHVPYSTEQNKEPSMKIEDIVKGLTVAIENLD